MNSTVHQWIGPISGIKSAVLCAGMGRKKDLPTEMVGQTTVLIRMGLETLYFRIGHKGGFVCKDGTETAKLVMAVSNSIGPVCGFRDLEGDGANRTNGEWREICKARIEAALDAAKGGSHE